MSHVLVILTQEDILILPLHSGYLVALYFSPTIPPSDPHRERCTPHPTTGKGTQACVARLVTSLLAAASSLVTTSMLAAGLVLGIRTVVTKIEIIRSYVIFLVSFYFSSWSTIVCT